ncbi:MAG: SDR family oxidoreductase [Bacteroidetes bacterium]|nr:SDR family oxidoreductase [Bacteroidota bacterium]
MNKKIVITGATKGIGRAVAEKFAQENFDLALCARNGADLEQLKAEIGKQRGESGEQKSAVFIQPCDVSKKEDLRNFSDRVTKQFGAVDIIVNNAGIFLPGQVYKEEEGVLEQLMATNLYSAYHLSRWLLPEMIKRKRGHIFTMCSVASIGAYPNGGSYSISKFAMLGLTKALREELKPFNIKVTAIISGAVYTDSWKGSGLPESRFMKAEDIGKVIWDTFHLSDSAVVEEIVLRPMLGDI